MVSRLAQFHQGSTHTGLPPRYLHALRPTRVTARRAPPNPARLLEIPGELVPVLGELVPQVVHLLLPLALVLAKHLLEPAACFLVLSANSLPESPHVLGALATVSRQIGTTLFGPVLVFLIQALEKVPSAGQDVVGLLLQPFYDRGALALGSTELIGQHFHLFGKKSSYRHLSE